MNIKTHLLKRFHKSINASKLSKVAELAFQDEFEKQALSFSAAAKTAKGMALTLMKDMILTPAKKSIKTTKESFSNLKETIKNTKSAYTVNKTPDTLNDKASQLYIQKAVDKLKNSKAALATIGGGGYLTGKIIKNQINKPKKEDAYYQQPLSSEYFQQ